MHTGGLSMSKMSKKHVKKASQSFASADAKAV